MLIQRDGQLENHALTIIPAQMHRISGSQCLSGPPARWCAGRELLYAGVIRRCPADLGKIGVFVTVGGKNLYFRAVNDRAFHGSAAR